MEHVDFSQPSEERNLALEVEGEKLWVSRETLALYSPVFKTMFYGDFRESQEETISLPGKHSADIRELLLVLTPPTLKPVDSDNVDLLLDMAREYSIDRLKERCNHFLQKALRKSAAGSDRHLDILVLACKYEMYDLMEQCIPKVAQLSYAVISGRKDELPTGVLAALFEAKLSKRKKHERHDLSGSPATPSSRPYANANGGFAQVVGSYFCSACNSQFVMNQQRLMCRFCRGTICDTCVRTVPCPKLLEHDDTCDCECEYDRNLLRR